MRGLILVAVTSIFIASGCSAAGILGNWAQRSGGLHLLKGKNLHDSHAGPFGKFNQALRDVVVMAKSTIQGNLTNQEKMLAGATARGISQTVLHPIDVVRTRLQAKGIKKNWGANTFLKGVIPQIALAVPAGALQFVGVEWCKEKLQSLLPQKEFSDFRVLVAAAGGAFFASVIRVPQEVLKQRIQADIYPNILVALPSVLRKDGFMGLYKGYAATVSRDVPWNALAFLFQNQGKRLFQAAAHRDCSDQENLIISSGGGMLAAIIMTPVDVVKTRLMTTTTGEYTGIFQTVSKIVREEGAGTLMKGVVPRVMYLAPLAGLTLSIYDKFSQDILRKKAAAAKAAATTAPAAPKK